ncbi:acyl-CoA dehydrogenase family protein [Amycolatopsis orientalis]|uniref:acyl-CoA dehydrogenase family protein n=1 Tax=Amycolatopsis orientalis TaxID=31958 RepID=UPI0003A98D49|nr:acyl-CoA dehydrogenase family protein [Amycolatopsis orientalis]
MTWRGPELDAEQRALAEMLDALAARRSTALSDETADAVPALVRELAGLGIWTIGTAESAGGGGADQVTAALAWERLGRYWPALGWASVQTHAAVDLLSSDPGASGLVTSLHEGGDAVAVVDSASVHVRLEAAGNGLRGQVDRVDAAHPRPHLLVLDGPAAYLVAPADLDGRPLRRTGLGGAQTCSLTVDAPEVRRVDSGTARVRLSLGAASVAAGIAGAAADAAIEYAAGRRQFGAALTALPAVRQALLDQASRVAVSVCGAASAPGGEVEAWSILRAACDCAVEVAAAALQSHGGYGYLTEYPAERFLRDAVSLRAAANVAGGAARAGRALVGAAGNVAAIGMEEK